MKMLKTKDYSLEIQLPKLIQEGHNLEKCYKEPLDFVWYEKTFNFMNNRNRVILIENIKTQYQFDAWFNLTQYQIYVSNVKKTVFITPRCDFINEHKQIT
jgi:hypothetical protein